jgi:hypothetical protein
MQRYGDGLSEVQRRIRDAFLRYARENNIPIKLVTTKMLYTRQVGEFIRKIERAHRDAEHSSLVFKTETS